MAPSQWESYSPDPTPDDEPPAPARAARPRTPSTARTKGSGRGSEMSPRARLVQRVVFGAIALVFVGVLAIVVLLVASLVRSDGAPQTTEGFSDLLADLAEEAGDTTVFEAVIYPEYAVLDVPFTTDDERSLDYLWDGNGLTETGRSTSSELRFDLADVDASLFADMCDAARRLVDDPGDCYLVVRRPAADDATQGWVSAYVSNDFSQGGYVEYDLDGTEVHRTSW